MSQSQGTSLDAAADIRALVHAQASAWAAGDAESIAGAFSDPCEFIVPGMRLTHPHEIQRAAEDHRARYRDVRVEVERIISQDDSAAVEWTWTDTDKKTGATARVQDAIVLRVAGGSSSTGGSTSTVLRSTAATRRPLVRRIEPAPDRHTQSLPFAHRSSAP